MDTESLDTLKKIACDAIDEIAADLHSLSTEIWNHPELGFEEHRAHKVLTDFLEKNGFLVERGYTGIETAFRATEGAGEGTHVGVMCEYDALPEIGHACGHNLIAEVGAGAGVGIRKAMKAAGKPIGKVTVLGTPNEEEWGGKLELIKNGAFKDLDIGLMAHPWSVTATGPKGSWLALFTCDVTFKGKASHAAGFPWEGVNALDAAVMAYNNVSCLRQQMKPSWRVHGVIRNGGSKPNIIPEETALEYYVRAPTMGEAYKLQEKVENCFKAAATATGCTVDIHWWSNPYENMITNRQLADLYESNAQAVGVEFCQDEEKLKSATGSTDMGNVSHVVPSIHPMFYIGGDAANHTREFTDIAGADKAQKYTLDQAKVLAMTALDVLCKPELLDIIKKQFQEDLEDDAKT